MALQRLRSRAGLVVGAAALGTMLVSSHGLAAGGNNTAPPSKGGVLACYGQRGINTPRGSVGTHFDLINNNDSSTIQIDRIAVFLSDGTLICEFRPPNPLGPHAIFHAFTENLASSLCPNWQPATVPGRYGVTFVISWSFTECRWPWNDLSGVTQMTTVEPSGQTTEMLDDCKPLESHP